VRVLKDLRQKIEDIRWEEAATPSFWVGFARRQVRLSFYILRELVRDRCLQQAASLTYTTLLSLVPLLAVAFSIFRAFAGMEGLATRAQDAIFETILAAPLMQTTSRAEPETAVEAVPVSNADLTPEGLLSDADRRSRLAEVGAALRLYLEALSRGADAAAVREGLSTLRLGDLAPSRYAALRQMAPQARAAYLSVAGLAEGSEGRLGVRTPDGLRRYESAMAMAEKGEVSEAVAEFLTAEETGFPAIDTRAAVARIYSNMADAQIAAGEYAQGIENRQKALLYYLDAVVMGCLARASDKEIGDAVQAHDEALTALGEALFARGRWQANLYAGLAGRADGEAERILEAAIVDLRGATGFLEHSSEVHRVLADVLWSAGRQEEARPESVAAYEKSREVVARGLSLALVDYIRIFIDKVGRKEIGIIGVLFLLITATSLLNSIEKTLNNIWKVTATRPIWIKFTSFCTLIWLGPALIGASIWARERLGFYIETMLGGLPAIGGVVGVLSLASRHLLPFITIWIVLVAFYKFLPHTRVKLGSVAWGAFLAALLIHGARPLFSVYVLKAVRYEKIYGSLGIVPIFLLWLWLLWIIVLLGAEVAFTIQNVGLLRYHDKMRRLSSIYIDRYLAARIMMYVAREFWETGQPLGAERLAEILGVTTEEASDAANRLVKLDLLTPVGDLDMFHPARDLSRLELSEVLSLTDRFRTESRSVQASDRRYEDRLEAVFRSAIQAQGDALSGMTFRDLLLQAEEAGRDVAEEPTEASDAP